MMLLHEIVRQVGKQYRVCARLRHGPVAEMESKRNETTQPFETCKDSSGSQPWATISRTLNVYPSLAKGPKPLVTSLHKSPLGSQEQILNMGSCGWNCKHVPQLYHLTCLPTSFNIIQLYPDLRWRYVNLASCLSDDHGVPNEDGIKISDPATWQVQKSALLYRLKVKGHYWSWKRGTNDHQ